MTVEEISDNWLSSSSGDDERRWLDLAMNRAPLMSIQGSPGRIVLSARSVFSNEAWSDAKALIERLLSIPSVALVRVDRASGQAEIRFDEQSPEIHETATILREFAAALRTLTTTAHLHDGYRLCPTFHLSKVNGQIVGGEISWIRAGETSLGHPLLCGKSSRRLVVKQMLEWDPQIHRVTVLGSSGNLLIEHPPEVSREQLLLSLERVLARIGDAACADHSRRQLLVGAGCVALALPAELVFPALIPVVAGALVVANFKTLIRGMRQLVALQWRLPALYAVIMGTTLISGQVLAAALMQVSIAGWYCWSNRRLHQLVERLLTSTSEFESLPAATRHSLSDQRAFESLYLEGRQARTVQPVQESLMRSLATISSNARATERCHEQASRFIPLTFATGVAAIATTDISTLAAVLRPDFSTGPSISEQILIVATMGDLLRHGWLVTHPEAMARFVAAERIVLFEIDDFDQEQPSMGIDGSNPEYGVRIRQEVWPLPKSKVSINVEVATGPAFACAGYAQRLASTEHDVVFCGPADLLNVIEGERVTRVALDFNDGDPASMRADFVAIATESSLRQLFDTLLAGTQRTRNGWSIVMTCNFASVLGAFILGLTSLHVVALTNLGTWAAFAATSGHDIRRKLNGKSQRPDFVNSSEQVLDEQIPATPVAQHNELSA